MGSAACGLSLKILLDLHFTLYINIPEYEWEAILNLLFVKYIEIYPVSLPAEPSNRRGLQPSGVALHQMAFHCTALLTGLNCRRGGPGGPADRALPGGGGAPGGRDGGRPGRQAHARQCQVSGYGGHTYFSPIFVHSRFCLNNICAGLPTGVRRNRLAS